MSGEIIYTINDDDIQMAKKNIGCETFEDIIFYLKQQFLKVLHSAVDSNDEIETLINVDIEYAVI
jgi:hypothetical protein